MVDNIDKAKTVVRIYEELKESFKQFKDQLIKEVNSDKSYGIDGLSTEDMLINLLVLDTPVIGTFRLSMENDMPRGRVDFRYANADSNTTPLYYVYITRSGLINDDGREGTGYAALGQPDSRLIGKIGGDLLMQHMKNI